MRSQDGGLLNIHCTNFTEKCKGRGYEQKLYRMQISLTSKYSYIVF